MDYDYRVLVQTYIETQQYQNARPDIKAYYADLLALLEQGFGVDFAAPPASGRALWMLFRATVDSYLSLRTPWSHFLEAGLIVRKLEDLSDQGQSIFHLRDRKSTRLNSSHVEIS